MKLTQEEFDREQRYQTVMHYVRQMMGAGLITQEEYCQIDTKYRRKFLPITGDLLSGKDLLFPESGGNMA